MQTDYKDSRFDFFKKKKKKKKKKTSSLPGI